MGQYEVSFNNIIEYPWTECEYICIGYVPKSTGTPDIYCLVKDNKKPFITINVYYEYSTTFKGAEVFGRYIIIGFCETVFLIDIITRSVNCIRVRGYFGYIYKYNNFALVASASDLLCFNNNGELVWISENLGIDGVIVHDFDERYIYGSGEFDPPGGWEEFRLIAKTGRKY